MPLAEITYSHKAVCPYLWNLLPEILISCSAGDRLVENEHLCQDIAARLGLLAARSSVLTLNETTYIVIERFDRLPRARGSVFVRRVHQEDMCQALGLMPGAKYQQDGGPGIPDIVALIRRVSSNPDDDVNRFIDANAFNWLIGGTDAHAKNYSLLIGADNQIRLSPLYDLSSQLPYPELIDQRVSMKIGDEYDIPLIGFSEWQALAEGLDRKVVTVLAKLLIQHANVRCATLNAAPSKRRRLRKDAH
jgi:serine/threonine-protein kinase HipA